MNALHSSSVDVRTPDGVADAYVACPDDDGAHGQAGKGRAATSRRWP